MQTDSECESDVSSIADSSTTNQNNLVINREHLIKRIDSLTQENRVLKVELETYKLRLKASQQEIKQLKQFVVFLPSRQMNISVLKCKCSYASES
jgi:coiled-coil domain-containing protein 6